MTQPFDHIEALTTKLIADADRIEDPIQRALELQLAISALGSAAEEIANARRNAVLEARKTMSAARLAEALGVTRARVYQLMDAGPTFEGWNPDHITKVGD